MRVVLLVVALVAEVVSAGTTDHPRLSLFGSPGEPVSGDRVVDAIVNQAHLALARPQDSERRTVEPASRALPATSGEALTPPALLALLEHDRPVPLGRRAIARHSSRGPPPLV